MKQFCIEIRHFFKCDEVIFELNLFEVEIKFVDESDECCTSGLTI